jgi:DNA-binding CsgD family transcriptional regulator
MIVTSSMSDETREKIHSLWDQLSDFKVSETDKAAHHLMERLCDMVGAANANWSGAVRMAGEHTDDPLKGWRISGAMQLHVAAEHIRDEPMMQAKELWNERGVDPCFLIPLQELGQFRYHILRRDLPVEWFEGSFFSQFYASAGIHDAVWVGFPLNEDAESYFGFHSKQAFTEEQAQLLAFGLRGIKWFHRQLMLSHGLLVASKPLMPRERDVLNLLLTDASEKQIADSLGLAVSTAHSYITNIFRKFGVRGRAALMSLWLNQP